MEEVCHGETLRLERKSLLPSPYCGPHPTQDHAKVVIETETEKVISGEVEKTL